MLRMLILLALPTSTAACIPTKHPEPGIPATTTTTTTTTPAPGCKLLGALEPLSSCDAAYNYPPNTCTAATRTAQSVTCGGGKQITIVGSKFATNNFFHSEAIKATCDITKMQWTFINPSGISFTQGAAMNTLGTNLMVACLK